MANTFNYASDTTSLRNQYNRYSVSRVIEHPLDELLEVEVPMPIQNEYFVEITLYSLANNAVVFNATIGPSSNSDIIKVVTLSYPDASVRRLMFIDFSKTLPDMPDGRFETVLNFFVPKIGNAATKPLTLTRISPSRTEVQLQLRPEFKTAASASLLTNFALPQINYTWAMKAMQYLCNQTQSLDPNIPTDTTPMSYDIISQFLPTTVSTTLNNPDVDDQYTASIKTSTQQLLNTTYNYATQSMQLAIQNNAIFTDQLLITIFSSSLSTAYTNYVQNVRYTLL
jgi:hypothetical protein